MVKIIAYLRVSGSRQSTMSQRVDLLNFIKSFPENQNVEIIEKNYVVSATNKEYELVMNDLINLIETQEIKCLYSTEFSRLARIPFLLEKLKNTLVSRKTNLITKHEGFRLFDEEGKISMVAKMMFDIHKNITEEEILRKNERVARGIAQAAENNRWLGGKHVLFGYMVDEFNNYQIDPENSRIVKDIYNHYVEGKHSFRTIEEDIFRNYNVSLNRLKIGKILHNKYYTGEKILKKGYKYERKYPKLIDIEDYNKVQTLLQQRSGRTQDKSKNIYLASRLIICSSCKSRLVAFNNQNTYKCKNYVEKKTCPDGSSIRLDLIDALALHVSKELDAIEKENFNEEKIQEAKQNIIEIENRIKLSESRLITIREKQKKKIEKDYSFLSGREKNELLERALHEDRQKIREENFEDEKEKLRLEKWIDSKKVERPNIVGWSSGSAIDTINEYDNIELTEKQKYDLTHLYIKNILLEKKDGFVEITIKTFCGKERKFKYNHRKRSNENRLFEILYLPTKKQKKILPLCWDEIVDERFE